MARYLTAADVEGRLHWPDVVEALRRGHEGLALAGAALGDQFLGRDADTLLSRAAWLPGLGAGVKSVTVLPGNPARGLPSVHGAMVVFADATGEVEAVIDSALVTRWKTAADSLLGSLLLARPEPERLVILGAGAVADSLVEGYRAAFPTIGDVAIWNRTPERAALLAERHGARAVADIAAAVGEADIVAAATMASEPVLRGEWVRPGTHVDLIGAFTAAMREADDALVRRARLFVDARETTLDHIGELLIPLREGTIARGDVLGDLADLVAGRAGREARDEITLFKNGGGAHLDLMTARAIMAAAGADEAVAATGDASPAARDAAAAARDASPAARGGRG